MTQTGQVKIPDMDRWTMHFVPDKIVKLVLIKRSEEQ